MNETVDSNHGYVLLPTDETVDSNTEYTCLRATPQLGISQDLYKLTSRLRLGSKPLSLEVRASTLILELEWVYQSSGQSRESQWMGYSLLYRPQPLNPAVGKSRQNFHSLDGPTYAKMQALDHPVQVAVAPFCSSR